MKIKALAGNAKMRISADFVYNFIVAQAVALITEKIRVKN